MSNLYPQAYHITWGTYGARLPGSRKPHVDKAHIEYKTPLAPPDPQKEHESREIMSQNPVRLTLEQRHCVEQAIVEVARRFEWTVHAIAPQSDHVHVVVTAMRDGDALREALKAAASRFLNKIFGKQKWWAEGGSDKHLWERRYFENAIDYVRNQRDF